MRLAPDQMKLHIWHRDRGEKMTVNKQKVQNLNRMRSFTMVLVFIGILPAYIDKRAVPDRAEYLQSGAPDGYHQHTRRRSVLSDCNKEY